MVITGFLPIGSSARFTCQIFPTTEELSKYLMGMIVVLYNDASCILVKCYTQLQLAGEVRENFTMLYTYTTKPRTVNIISK